MSKNIADDTFTNKLVNIVNDLQKQFKEFRTNQLVPSDWIAPTLINSWVNYGLGYEVAGYYKDALGIVHLKGLVTGGASSSVCFVLPSGYRPTAYRVFAVVGGGAFASVTIGSDGSVFLVGSPGIALDSISFKA